MAFDAQVFIGDILKDVQVDDVTKQALSSITTNPVVAKRLEEGYLRQSEFSKLASTYQEKIKGAQDYWDGLAKWKQDEEKRFTDERQRLGLNPEEKPTQQVDYDKKLQQLAEEAIKYNNTLVTLAGRHMKEFNDVLDTDALLKEATTSGTNINIAYDRLVQPKRQEIQQQDIVKQLEAARKEGAEEAIKNFKIPTAETTFNTGGIPHALDRFESKDKAPDFGPMAAVKAFQTDRATGKRPDFNF